VSKTGNSVVITVSDQGEGIPEDIRKNIFESSIQTSFRGTDGEIGSGFGLPIAKLFTNKMGGEIGFETSSSNDSGPNGTTFFLKFSV